MRMDISRPKNSMRTVLATGLGTLLSASIPGVAIAQASSAVTGCPASAVEKVSTHTVQSGETLDSIAATYGIVAQSILAFNSTLQSGTVTVGDRLQIPPYNGSLHAVSPGASWQDLADQYGMRADVLFEANGCGMTPPSTVFIPGIGSPVVSAPQPTVNTLPLAEPLTFNTLPIESQAAVALGYGWHSTSNQGAPLFHSGLDFSADMGTSVITVADGTVAFAGERGSYGKVVVINHDRGVQTRYAQLSDIQVSLGDTVREGEQIGESGQSGTIADPHLHFEVRLNSNSGWVAQDPYLYLNTLE